jgi:hypothetical protein
MKRFSEFAAGGALAAALFLGMPGCTATVDVPQDAQLMSEGTGEVSARAPHAGTVYIVDTSDNKIVYKGDVARDQLVTVDGDHNKITSNGETLTSNINGGHHYKIMFERNDHVVTRTETTETRTTQVPVHTETTETRTEVH